MPEPLEELRRLLTELPTQPKPDMGKIIALGLAAGWPDRIEFCNTQRRSTESVAEILMIIATLGGGETNQEGAFVQPSPFGDDHLTLGPWLEVVEAMKAWEGNYHLIWPETQVETPKVTA